MKNFHDKFWRDLGVLFIALTFAIGFWFHSLKSLWHSLTTSGYENTIIMAEGTDVGPIDEVGLGNLIDYRHWDGNVLILTTSGYHTVFIQDKHLYSIDLSTYVGKEVFIRHFSNGMSVYCIVDTLACSQRGLIVKRHHKALFNDNGIEPDI